MEDVSKLSIKAWAEDDRPREKLLIKGRSALSDAELIAILIGSGTREVSAVELSQHILNSVNNDLHELGRKQVTDLMKFKGIGEAKAITIAAALELGRRRKSAEHQNRRKITASQHAYEEMLPVYQDLPHEEFWILLLNRSNKVMKRVPISRGGVSGTVADPKLIFKPALDALASSMILSHNHPSGNLSPSRQDIELTRKMIQAGKVLDIAVLDHIIVTDNGYYSFADEGQMHT